MSDCCFCGGTGFRERWDACASAPAPGIDAPRTGLLEHLWPCGCNTQRPARYTLDGREYVLERGAWQDVDSWEQEQRLVGPRLDALRERLFLPPRKRPRLGSHEFLSDFNRFQHELKTIAIQATARRDDA